MKKFLALLMAAMMLLATAGFAFAETLDNQTAGHSYDVYQIFKATQSDTDEADGIIGVTGWGDGVNGEALLAALKADTVKGSLFATCNTAMDVAKVLGDNNSDSDLSALFAELAHKNLTSTKAASVAGVEDETTINLEKGYYLFVDTTNTNTSASENAATDEETYKNLALLQVVTKGDVTIQRKNEVPSVTKKVFEDQNDIAWNDAADYDIGDAVPFKLTATLPSATWFNLYETYTLKFWDEMDDGLTFNDDVVVKLNGTTVIPESNYTATPDEDLHGFNVVINDVKALTDAEGNAITVTATDTFVVEYTATLNGDCKKGVEGNVNKVYLEYSNNPNYNGSGETGKTPEDKVVVFTFVLQGTKVDAGNNETVLEGAKFAVYNSDKSKYITAIDATTKVITWASEGEEYEFTSDEDGLFTVVGLDDGTYYLKETQAPVGYALPSDPWVLVELTGVTAGTQTWDGTVTTIDGTGNTLSVKSTVGTKESTGNVENGVANVTITNTKGGTLPETGGIGTTLFYLFGSVMAAGSALILVVRRRAEAEAE